MPKTEVKVTDIFEFIHSIAPFDTQAVWDNSGLLIGGKDNVVNKIAVCLDVTDDTVSQAIDFGADLIVSHHPVIWDPLKFVDFDTPVGRAIRNGVSIISAHTNWDLAQGGVNDVLANLLGLADIKPLAEEGEEAMLRVGKLKTPVPAEEFAEVVSTALDTVVRVANPTKMIQTVAVCGGSGASFLPALPAYKVDALVTGDAKHNDYLDAVSLDMALLAAGHYETETVSMPVLMELLTKEFKNLDYKYIESVPAIYIG